MEYKMKKIDEVTLNQLPFQSKDKLSYKHVINDIKNVVNDTYSVGNIFIYADEKNKNLVSIITINCSAINILKYNEDVKPALMLTDSYNKNVSFKLAVGGYIVEDNTCMITDPNICFKRHTKNIENNVHESIIRKVKAITNIYMNLDNSLNSMKVVSLSMNQQQFILNAMLNSKLKIISESNYKLLMKKATELNCNVLCWDFYKDCLRVLNKNSSPTRILALKRFHLLITACLNKIVNLTQPDFYEPNIFDNLDITFD